MSEFLEGPPSEDEARIEVIILSFSRSRMRPRARYTFFSRPRTRRGPRLSFFLFLANFEDKSFSSLEKYYLATMGILYAKFHF